MDKKDEKQLISSESTTQKNKKKRAVPRKRNAVVKNGKTVKKKVEKESLLQPESDKNKVEKEANISSELNQDVESNKVEDKALSEVEIAQKSVEEAQRGVYVAQKDVLEAQKDEITARQNELNSKKEELGEKQREIVDKQQEIESKKKEIEEQRIALALKIKELEGKQGELKTKTKELEAKKDEISIKQEQLEAKKDELEIKKSQLDGKIYDKDENVSYLQREASSNPSNKAKKKIKTKEKSSSKKKVSWFKGFVAMTAFSIFLLACIAVLLTYFVNKKESPQNYTLDQRYVMLLNDTLKSKEENGEDISTMHDALSSFDNCGLDIVNRTFSKGELVWDSTTKRFAIVDGDDVIYRDSRGIANKQEDLFKAYNTYADSLIDNKDYSVYLLNTTETEINNLTTGLDVGENTGITSINYINNANIAKNIVIRTNGGTVKVNAPLDSIKHYGIANYLNITAINTTACWEEFGYIPQAQIVTGKIINTAGNIEVNNKTEKVGVQSLFIQAKDVNSFDEVIVEAKENAELPSFDRSEVTIGANGTLVVKTETANEAKYIYLYKAGIEEQLVVKAEKEDVVEEDIKGLTGAETQEVKDAAKELANIVKRDANGKVTLSDGITKVDPSTLNSITEVKDTEVEKKITKEEIEESSSLFAGGTGSKTNPFLISNIQNLYNITALEEDMLEGKKYYFKQIADIDLTNEKYKNSSNNSVYYNNNYAIHVLNGSYDAKKSNSENYNIYFNSNCNYFVEVLCNGSEIKNVDLYLGNVTAHTFGYVGVFATETDKDGNYPYCVTDAEKVELTQTNVNMFGKAGTIYALSNNQGLFDSGTYCTSWAILNGELVEESGFNGLMSSYDILTGSNSTPYHLVIKDCSADVNLTTTGYAGVISGGQSYGISYDIDGFTYYGTFSGNQCGLIFGNDSGFNSYWGGQVTAINVSNITLSGRIISTNSKSSCSFGHDDKDNDVFSASITGIEKHSILANDATLNITLNENEYTVTPSTITADKYLIQLGVGKAWRTIEGYERSNLELAFEVSASNVSDTNVYRAKVVDTTQITSNMKLDLSNVVYKTCVSEARELKYAFVENGDGQMYLVINFQGSDGWGEWRMANAENFTNGVHVFAYNGDAIVAYK